MGCSGDDHEPRTSSCAFSTFYTLGALNFVRSKIFKTFSNLIIFDPTLGLLSVLGGLLGDAMAEKRSRLETWRVRECVALCVKMVASATHILQGASMDDVQGALIRRQAMEINQDVRAVITSNSDLHITLSTYLITKTEEVSGAMDRAGFWQVHV